MPPRTNKKSDKKETTENMASIIRKLVDEKGIPEKAVLSMIEDSLKAAYKRHFGQNIKPKKGEPHPYENAIVKFADDLSEVYLYSRKLVLDGIYDPVVEIELEDALKLKPDCNVGDELDILIDPREFDFSTIQIGKQSSRQSLSEIQKDRLFAEFKDKVGEIVVGTCQREDKNRGTIYVDLGKVEGVLPKKYQSPREQYEKNDRIRALVTDVKRAGSKGASVHLELSRTDPNFVRKIMEQEIPETYDKTVEIFKIVREPGYRTKVAVYSHREDIDPVGACVGLKGVRIQSVIRELDGEKIDVLKYDSNPAEFIKNALAPAEVSGVVILDEEKRQALAVVSDSQLSLAIGKQGQNVRLANRLVDWNIDVKTEDQYEELDQLIADSRKAAEELFSDEIPTINTLAELPGVNQDVVAVLRENSIEDIEQFLEANEEGRLDEIEGLSAEDIAAVENLINDVVEFVEEEESEEEEEYFCPECNTKITTDMTSCPNCHIGLSFEEEE